MIDTHANGEGAVTVDHLAMQLAFLANAVTPRFIDRRERWIESALKIPRVAGGPYARIPRDVQTYKGIREIIGSL